MLMTFTEVKGHQRSNVVNYATFLNIVILYYLLMRRDVWFANHLVSVYRAGDNTVFHGCPVTAAYPESTLNGTPTCNSLSGSASCETYVVGQEKCGCARATQYPFKTQWKIYRWSSKLKVIFSNGLAYFRNLVKVTHSLCNILVKFPRGCKYFMWKHPQTAQF